MAFIPCCERLGLPLQPSHDEAEMMIFLNTDLGQVAAVGHATPRAVYCVVHSFPALPLLDL